MDNSIDEKAPKMELREILVNTNKENPEKKDIRALQNALKNSPALWRSVGDLARKTQNQLIDNAKGAFLIKESIRYGLEEMRQEFGFENASPLERLLIEQVTLAWLHYYLTQWSYNTAHISGMTIGMAGYWERRLNGAQRRYMRALETLARIRKMGPAIQINIAKNQVNQHMSTLS